MRAMVLRRSDRRRPDPVADRCARLEWELDRLQRELGHARRDVRWWRQSERRVSVEFASFRLLVGQVLAQPGNERARHELELRLAEAADDGRGAA